VDQPVSRASSRLSANALQECAWVLDAAPAYALGGLDTADSARIARHARDCENCAGQIDSLGSVVPLLGLASEQRDPPAALKQRLIASLDSPSLSAPHAPMVLSAIPPVRHAVTPIAASRQRALSSRFATLALLTATLLLGLWMLGAQRELNVRDAEIDRLNSENEALALHLDSIRAGQQVFGNSGVWYPLARVNRGSDNAGGIMLSAQEGTTTLLSVWNMPEEHDSYHVICESKLGELLSAGKIEVNERGNGYATLTLPAPMSEYRAVHVIPTGQMSLSDGAFPNDILQLLISEPTIVATIET
jgi:hypothetical protein